MGVRDLGCVVELRSVPGCDAVLVLLMLGLREGCVSLMRGPAADTGGQGVLGEVLILLLAHAKLPWHRRPLGVNHWCTRLSRRMLGMPSASRCSPG